MRSFGKRLCVLGLMFLLVGAALWLALLGRVSLPWENTELENRGSGPGARLKTREDEADKTVWSKEILAQNCGLIIESFWDSVNRATNKLSIVAAFDSDEFVLGRWESTKVLPHGIEVRESIAPGPILTPGQWRSLVEDPGREGWQLDNLEFRH